MNSKNYHQKKRFGQHWLVNKKILEKIKEVADLNENDIILEIGPGKGALTSKLLDSEIKRLHAIELDKDLINLLNDKFNNNDKFSLQQGDILSVNLDSINKKIFNNESKNINNYTNIINNDNLITNPLNSDDPNKIFYSLIDNSESLEETSNINNSLRESEINQINMNSKKDNFSKKLTTEEELYDEFNYLLDE